MRTLLMLMAIVVTSCSSASSAEVPRIEVTSEGGISGRGVGGVTIERGTVSATDTRRTCSGTLTDDERSSLQKHARIASSEARGTGHPDQIRYTMTVGDQRASWYGEEPPADIAELWRAVWRVRARVLGGC